MLRVLCLDELSALSINVCFYILYMVKVLIILEKKIKRQSLGTAQDVVSRVRALSLRSYFGYPWLRWEGLSTNKEGSCSINIWGYFWNPTPAAQPRPPSPPLIPSSHSFPSFFPLIPYPRPTSSLLVFPSLFLSTRCHCIAGSSMDKLFITNEALAAKPATIAKLAYKLIFQAVSSIDGRALNAVQEHPYSPPVSAMVAFSKVVKNNTALAVVHVEGNKMYDATKPSDVASFKKLVLSGGNHSFKVVMRPTLKGGTPTPTDFDAVGEALQGLRHVETVET